MEVLPQKEESLFPDNDPSSCQADIKPKQHRFLGKTQLSAYGVKVLIGWQMGGDL